uniref:Uncharacterized protein n=1 Tax=Arundo donax TaxID=35708 RepID=A0A0A8ZQ87_ARUDO
MIHPCLLPPVLIHLNLYADIFTLLVSQQFDLFLSWQATTYSFWNAFMIFMLFVGGAASI